MFEEKLFPELLLFDRGKERRRMKRRVMFNTRTLVACGLLTTFFVLGGPHLFLRIHLARLGLPHWAVTLVVSLCVGGLVYAAAWVTRRAVRRFLRVQLVNKGISICLTCGYQLRGQVEPRCPECGTGFDIRHPPQDRASDE